MFRDNTILADRERDGGEFAPLTVRDLLRNGFNRLDTLWTDHDEFLGARPSQLVLSQARLDELNEESRRCDAEVNALVQMAKELNAPPTPPEDDADDIRFVLRQKSFEAVDAEINRLKRLSDLTESSFGFQRVAYEFYTVLDRSLDFFKSQRPDSPYGIEPIDPLILARDNHVQCREKMCDMIKIIVDASAGNETSPVETRLCIITKAAEMIKKERVMDFLDMSYHRILRRALIHIVPKAADNRWLVRSAAENTAKGDPYVEESIRKMERGWIKAHENEHGLRLFLDSYATGVIDDFLMPNLDRFYSRIRERLDGTSQGRNHMVQLPWVCLHAFNSPDGSYRLLWQRCKIQNEKDSKTLGDLSPPCRSATSIERHLYYPIRAVLEQCQRWEARWRSLIVDLPLCGSHFRLTSTVEKLIQEKYNDKFKIINARLHLPEFPTMLGCPPLEHTESALLAAVNVIAMPPSYSTHLQRLPSIEEGVAKPKDRLSATVSFDLRPGDGLAKNSSARMNINNPADDGSIIGIKRHFSSIPPRSSIPTNRCPTHPINSYPFIAALVQNTNVSINACPCQRKISLPLPNMESRRIMSCPILYPDRTWARKKGFRIRSGLSEYLLKTSTYTKKKDEKEENNHAHRERAALTQFLRVAVTMYREQVQFFRECTKLTDKKDGQEKSISVPTPLVRVAQPSFAWTHPECAALAWSESLYIAFWVIERICPTNGGHDLKDEEILVDQAEVELLELTESILTSAHYTFFTHLSLNVHLLGSEIGILTSAIDTSDAPDSIKQIDNKTRYIYDGVRYLVSRYRVVLSKSLIERSIGPFFANVFTNLVLRDTLTWLHGQRQRAHTLSFYASDTEKKNEGDSTGILPDRTHSDGDMKGSDESFVTTETYEAARDSTVALNLVNLFTNVVNLPRECMDTTKPGTAIVTAQLVKEYLDEKRRYTISLTRHSDASGESHSASESKLVPTATDDPDELNEWRLTTDECFILSCISFDDNSLMAA